MKKLLIVVVLFGSVSVKSQNFIMKEGDVITQQTNIYSFKMPFEKKWRKMNKLKKAENVLAFNKTVLEGSEKPWRETPAKFRIEKIEKADGVEKCTMKAFDSGFEYETSHYLTNDTMYIVRNENPFPVKNPEGKETGMTIQGIQKIPNNLKIGDKLPKYYDITMMYPTKWKGQMTEKIYAGRQTSTSNDFGIHTDSRTGVRSLGNFKVTTSYDVYKDIKHEVTITETISGHTIHYVDAYVVDSTVLKLGGKDYTAFLIESETWTKMFQSIKDYSAERQDLAEKMKYNAKKANEKLEKRMNKKSAKLGWQNKQGYIVMVFQEWFVPNYGIVKFKTYGLSGCFAVLSDSELIQK